LRHSLSEERKRTQSSSFLVLLPVATEIAVEVLELLVQLELSNSSAR